MQQVFNFTIDLIKLAILSSSKQLVNKYSIVFIESIQVEGNQSIQIYNLLKRTKKKMIRYYTSSTYRKHYSDLEKLNMLNETLQLQPYQLSVYVLRNPKENTTKAQKSPTKHLPKSTLINDPQRYFIQLIQDLQIYKNLTITPIKAFKSLLLIHCCFLLVKTTPNQDNVNKLNSYFKWILEETMTMIQKHSTKENKKRTSSHKGSGDFFSRSSKLLQGARSLRGKSPAITSTTQINQRPKSTGKYASEQMLSKELCLLSSIIKPYILYLQKLLSIYSHYQSLMHSIPSTIETSESAWTVLNIFKLMAPMISIFVYIGRYFYKDYAPIVHLLIEFFTKEVCRLYPVLKNEVKQRTQKIQHQWFLLLEKHSEYEIMHNSSIEIKGVDDTMVLVEEILKVNESLFYIYYSKHFYQVVERLQIPAPKWVQINSRQCEFIYQYAESKDKSKRRSSSRTSKEKTKQMGSSMKLPHSGGPPTSPRPSNAGIDKKNLIPKAKNSLKLNPKDNKDDTITFRKKQINNLSSNRSKIVEEVSFRHQGSTEGSENSDNLQRKLENVSSFGDM